MNLPAHAPLVVATRGGITESVHYGSIAVVDRAGHLVSGVGDPAAPSFTRSALKPFQALPFVEDGGLGRYNFGSHELALMCASHSGEPVHLEIAARILERIGAAESDLQCGSHAPAFYAATGQAPPVQEWSALCHNCSGKHSGFLSWCRLHSRPFAEYLDPAAPLQRRIEAGLRRLVPGVEFARGIDGCSAPNYAMPLASLAHLYARLASGESDEFAAIRFAMTRHPDLVSGTKRADLALMLAGGGNWVAKAGAAGVQAMGIASDGLGIAIRIADGSVAALRIATRAVLEQLGLKTDAEPLEDFAAMVIRNDRGTEVGAIEARFKL